MKFHLSLSAAAMITLSLTGCATQAQNSEQNKQLTAINASTAMADNQPSRFMYQLSNGGKNTNVGTLLGFPASLVVTDMETKSSCHFRSSHPSSTVDFGATEGVHYQVIPLEESQDGVRTLLSITRTKISGDHTELVTVGQDACSLTVGDFSGDTLRIVQTLPIGKPVAVKMSDGTTYTVTATKL